MRVLKAAALAAFLLSAVPSANAQVQYLPHPEGCPRVLFCGCGLSIYIFGKNIRDLWSTRRWFQFPKAEAAAGMVAVRVGHVFGLIHHIKGDIWMVYDANSGGHKTRIHPRSIRGFSIRNPRGNTDVLLHHAAQPRSVRKNKRRHSVPAVQDVSAWGIWE